MRRALPTLVLVLTIASLSTYLLAEPERWSGFRGPLGSGHAPTGGLPLEWDEKKNVTWRTELPGKGWSSPVIEGNEVWMTTAVETPLTEKERKALADRSSPGFTLVSAASVSFRAVCVDKSSGKLLHDVELLTRKKPEPIHNLNSFASPTPIVEDGRLYAHFGTYGTACLDTKSQNVVWTNRELQLKHENGPGSSPILWKDKIIFHCDGSDVQYIAALNKRDGKIAWKTDRSGKLHDGHQMRKAYGTPHVVKIDGKDQLISPGADWVYSYDPASGEELWKIKYGVLGFSIVPRPVVGHGMIYMCTSFMKSQLLAIKYKENGKRVKPHIAWRFKRQVPSMPSPILVGDEIYFVNDKGGIVTCLDAHTGKEIWKSRIGGNYSASPLYVDGRIFFFSREGVSTAIQPGKKFKKLTANQIDGQLMASPAVANGALFLRSGKALYRIEKPSRKGGGASSTK